MFIASAALHRPTYRRCSMKRYSEHNNSEFGANEPGVGVNFAPQLHHRNAPHQAPRWCTWVGMTDAGWESWGRLHVKPRVAACYYMSAVAANLTTIGVKLTGMTDFRPLYLYVCTYPFVGSFVIGALSNVALWRAGHSAPQTVSTLDCALGVTHPTNRFRGIFGARRGGCIPQQVLLLFVSFK